MTFIEKLRENKQDVVEKAKSNTLRELSILFDVPYHTMVKFTCDNDIKAVKKFYGNTEDEIKKLAKEKTSVEIAKELNAPLKEVRCYLNYHGITAKRYYHEKGIKAERNEMILYLSQRFTYESIGKAFGISRQRVEQINQEYGVAK